MKEAPDMTEAGSIHESPFTTPEGRHIRDAVRAAVPLIRENAPEGEKIGCLASPTLEALHEAGVFRASVPMEFGGYALGARDLAEIVSAAASGDGSAGWTTMIASGFTLVQALFAARVSFAWTMALSAALVFAGAATVALLGPERRGTSWSG